MKRDYEAANALNRIRAAVAFSIPQATRRVKLNQFATLYEFADGSRLRIRHAAQRGDAWHLKWQGVRADMHLRPIQGAPLRINARGE